MLGRLAAKLAVAGLFDLASAPAMLEEVGDDACKSAFGKATYAALKEEKKESLVGKLSADAKKLYV